MPAITYPFDTTGLAPSNLITNETHTLTEVNANTYRIFIPEFSPFYLDNLTLTHVSQVNVLTPLVEGVHYNLCLPFIGASRSTGKMLYGGISISDSIINGTIRINYQTLGGVWTADVNHVLTMLANLAYNPRITTWDSVTNVQQLFPPTVHNQHMDTVFGHQALIDKLQHIADTIAANAATTPPGLLAHLLDDQNPHMVTAAQIGLGSVQNFPLATDNEVINRQPVDKYITLRQILLLLS